MADYFPVNTGVHWGAKLKQFRDQLRNVIDLGRDISGKLNATVIAGTPNNYSQTESVFGLTPIGTETDTDSAGFKVLFQVQVVMEKIDSNAATDNAKAAIQQFLDQVS